MTLRVGAKGQIVIPKKIRDTLGIAPGDRMEFWTDGKIVMAKKAAISKPLRGRFRDDHLVQELAGERASERERDIAR